MVEIKGALTAMITPFNEDGTVDYEGYRKNVRFQLENGIDGLVPLGTTGETPSLKEEEKEKIIKIVVEEAKGKVPIIVGTGTNCTSKTVEVSIKAEKLGADGILVVTPYYNKPTPDGLYQHFKAVNDAVNIPIIVYNVPGRCGKNIDTPVMSRISGLSNAKYVKEASGSMSQIQDVILDTGLNVLAGDDCMAVPTIAMGGKGVISVLANLLPEKMSKMCEFALNGKFDEAKKLHHEMQHLMRASFFETNPIPIKYMVRKFGNPAGIFRLPMVEPTDETKKKIDALLEKNNLMKS